MNRPTMLYQAMLVQISIDLKVSVERDVQVIEHRFKHEGLSFLTIVLPTLSDSLESGLELGRFTLPNGFKPLRRGGTLPAFLQGLFKRVFRADGSLLAEPCVESIYWIRQITRFFKKPKLACSPQREAAAIKRFKLVEEELRAHIPSNSRIDPILDSVAAILWSTIFPNIDDRRIVCAHGPGVTADRLLSNSRRRIRQWNERSEFSFPVADHAFHNYGAAWDGGSSAGVSGIKFLSVRDEIPVRVVFVPKTMTAPRVIAIEPSHVQFIQQGLSRMVVQDIEAHRLTSGSINFSDQTINRRLAYTASLDRRLTTMDLSDASDRVSLTLVRRIFKRSPILEYLEDSRSLSADLPDGSNIVLEKFASMGSALCFPIEACVFYTLILAAIHNHLGIRPSFSSILQMKKDIYVYGDDLIIPVQYTDVVADYLESYALRVNRRKTFSKSLFRESCGADFYQGTSVLPIYARQLFPARKSDLRSDCVLAWIATADQFYETGKWHVAQTIRSMLESVIGERLPRATKPGVGLAFRSFMFDTQVLWNRKYQTYGRRQLCYTPVYQKDSIDGDAAACFNKVFEQTDQIDERLYEHDRLHGRSHYDRLKDWNRSLVQVFTWQSAVLNREGTNGAVRLALWLVCYRSLVLLFSTAEDRVLYSDHRVPSTVLEIDPSRIDFDVSTRRGALALKRRWVVNL